MASSGIESERLVITGGQGDLARALRAECERESTELVPSCWQVFAPGRDEMDVSSEESVRSYFDGLRKQGVVRLDAVVHNAGELRDAPLAKLAEEDWDTVIQSHLRGAFLVAREAYDLLGGGGHLVLIGSRSARTGPRGQANYAAAKAALCALGQSLAREWGPPEAGGVRVNVVLPGFLETKMTRGLSDKVREAVRSECTLGEFTTVENAARFMRFLLGQPGVSGQVFALDSRIDRWG